MDNRLDIASATGVDLHLHIAGPGARSFAFVIDWHIRLLLTLAWMAAVALVTVGDLSLPEGDSFEFDMPALLVVAPAFILYFFYHPVLEIAMQGRTPGKRMAGVRILTTDGQAPGILAHLVRNVLRLLDSSPVAYAIGLTCTVFTQNSVRIGDLAAGTVLVYDTDGRAAAKNNTAISAEAAERLGLTNAELIQDVLARWDDLEDDKRCSIAARLLQQFAAHSAPENNAASLRAQLQLLLEDNHR